MWLEVGVCCLHNKKHDVGTRLKNRLLCRPQQAMSFQNNYQDDVEESDDDLYSFNQRENDNFAGFAVNNLQAASFRPAPQSFHAPLQQQPPPRTGFGGNPWQNNMGEDVQRPMTSVNAVGYSSDHDKRSMLSENLASMNRNTINSCSEKASASIA